MFTSEVSLHTWTLSCFLPLLLGIRTLVCLSRPMQVVLMLLPCGLSEDAVGGRPLHTYPFVFLAECACAQVSPARWEVP